MHKLFIASLRGFTVLLFRRLYELRAEEAAAGERVVVVRPPCAGKTTFIKQFLEPRGVETAEETVGLALGGAAGEGLVQRLCRRVWGRYVWGLSPAPHPPPQTAYSTLYTTADGAYPFSLSCLLVLRLFSRLFPRRVCLRPFLRLRVCRLCV